MAKRSEDREDLLRDGRAMPIRGRAWIDQNEVVIGFRSGGQVSLYWDQDPVLQFNAGGELRRLFMAGHRYAAHQGTLARLDQQPAGSKPVDHVRLHRQEISTDDQDLIDTRWRRIRQSLLGSLVDQTKWEVVGTAADDFAERCRSWIQLVDGNLKIAQNPSVG